MGEALYGWDNESGEFVSNGSFLGCVDAKRGH
jgi:hypothetical protein